MSDIIGIASNAVASYQRALGTVSNNIANVNTEGYSRQEVVLKDTAPRKAANMFFGTGVALQSVKRQFDAFAESNLRNSTSDLSSQEPMVNYTKRVIDIMGDKSVGLSSALDDFFSAANALSADPASSVLRSSFLRGAEGVSSRFAELSGQLNLVGTETNQALESTTKQVNTLTTQLALVNQNMAGSSYEDGQSSEILDRRDLILRQLSNLVRIKATFNNNGSVDVAIGSTATQGVVVSGVKSRPIGIDTSVPGKLELLLDPYGDSESLASASGGQLGGLQTFISQVLEPAQKSLNFLAKTLVHETNLIQTNGIDGYGQTGQELFALDPRIKDEAAAIKVSLNDAMRVATAAQFRATENQANSSNTRVSVSFTPSPTPLGISNTNLVNNPNPTAGVTIKVDGARVIAPVTTLAAGVKATFYLDDAKPGQQLQVLTRDGRQLLGKTLSETEKFQMLNAENGFVPNSIYSDAYLNKSGADGYRGMNIFYGAKAEVRYAQVFDRNGIAAPPTAEPAVLQTSRITDNPAGTQIEGGAIQLNGIALPALETQKNTPLSPKDVAQWINGTSKIDITEPKFNGVALSLGGVALSVQNLKPNQNNLVTLASDLQTQLRLLDGTKNITVSVSSNGTDLKIVDALGRSLSKVILTPEIDKTSVSGNVYTLGDTTNVVTNPNAVKFAIAIDGAGKNIDLTARLIASGVDLTLVTADEIKTAMQNELQSQFDPSITVDAGGASEAFVVSDALGRGIYLSQGLGTGALFGLDKTSVTGSVTNLDDSTNILDNPGAVKFAIAVDGGAIKNIDLTTLLTTYGADPTQVTADDIRNALQDELQAQYDSNINVEAGGAGQAFVITDALGRSMDVTQGLGNGAIFGTPTNGSIGLSVVGASKNNLATGGNVYVNSSFTSQTNVRAEVYNDIRVPSQQIDFKRPLRINNQLVPSVYRDVTSLVAAINSTPNIGVTASIQQGDLVITAGRDGFNNGTPIVINLTPTVKGDGNALGLSPTTYNGQVRMVQVVRDLSIPSTNIDFTKKLEINGVTISTKGLTTVQQLADQINAPGQAQSQSVVYAGADPVEGDTFSIALNGTTFTYTANTDDGLTSQAVRDGLVSQINANKSLGMTATTTANSGEIVLTSDSSGNTFTLENLQSNPNTTATVSTIVPKSQSLVFAGTNPAAGDTFSVALNGTTYTYTANTTDGLTNKAIRESLIALVNADDTLPVTASVGTNNGEMVLTSIAEGLPFTFSNSQNSATTTVSAATALKPSPNVKASIGFYGDLILSTIDASGESAISIGPRKNPDGTFEENALGLEPIDYTVEERLKMQLAADPSKSSIRLSFGTYGDPPKTGSPSDLTKAGLRTGAYIEGGSQDDLLVFVSGQGKSTVAASYTGEPLNMRDNLRGQSLLLNFTASDRYTITDAKTGTQLADRHYDTAQLEPLITFEGLLIKLSHAPSVGDSFEVDGNHDGLGNNSNMLDMVDLSKKPVIEGKSLANTYIDQINNVGNLAQQATITQQALTVVHDQSVAARDKVSGVNLDEEAASLIRYQQAYQASAKALQISGTLFDAIVQIR